jgi:hypothetical protein
MPRLLLFLSIILLLTTASCKKCDDPCNKECDNYDPCCLAETVSADFRVRPGNRGFAPPGEWCTLLPTDTFNSSSVLFNIPVGNPETSTYEWQIGSEPEPRTQHSFEISFSDYLNQGNWESSIPITLTVRTPLNACWENPDDTLVTMTRELFFTRNQIDFLFSDTIMVYKGYFTGYENEERILTFYRSLNKGFRGENPPVTLLLGTPLRDTLMLQKINCGFEICNNYFHFKGIFHNVDKCSFSPLSNFMNGYDMIFIDRERHIRHIYHFDNSPSLEFTGVRLQ